MGELIGAGWPPRRVCHALGLHRTTAYRHRTTRAGPHRPAVDERLAGMVRTILNREETFGYRRVWAELRFRQGLAVNVKKVHRVMQVKGWQCRVWNRPGRKGPRVATSHSTLDAPDRLWSTDLTRIWCGRDGWGALVAVLDNGSREVVGYRFAVRGRAREAAEALEQAITQRYGSAVPAGLRLRSDNGSIFLAGHYLRTARAWGVRQEYIPGSTPECNGVIERFMRTLKQECVWLHHFESFTVAARVIAAWVHRYNHERLHSALGYRTPVEWRQNFYAVTQVA